MISFERMTTHQDWLRFSVCSVTSLFPYILNDTSQSSDWAVWDRLKKRSAVIKIFSSSPIHSSKSFKIYPAISPDYAERCRFSRKGSPETKLSIVNNISHATLKISVVNKIIICTLKIIAAIACCIKITRKFILWGDYGKETVIGFRCIWWRTNKYESVGINLFPCLGVIAGQSKLYPKEKKTLSSKSAWRWMGGFFL